MTLDATFSSSSVSAVPAPAGGGVDRFVEFLLVGGSTLFLLPLAWLVRRSLGLDAAEYAVGFTTFYGAYVINDPHFAVTYLLFYKNARARAFSPRFSGAQRARYVVAGAVVPGLLVAWGGTALALRSAQSIGWMVQLMFLLVGWHYVKQGFGVLTILSARRGVRFLPRERSVLLAHCFAGWAYAWASPAMAAGEFEEKGVVYFSPAHPRWLEVMTLVAFAASTVALVAVLAAKWRRERRVPPLVPLCGLLVTVWSWTIYSSFDPLLRYAIPALHSIQYLYFVWLMRRNEARAEEGPPSFGPPVAVRVGALAVSALALGWLLFRGGPAFLDGIAVARARHHGADAGRSGRRPFLRRSSSSSASTTTSSTT